MAELSKGQMAIIIIEFLVNNGHSTAQHVGRGYKEEVRHRYMHIFRQHHLPTKWAALITIMKRRIDAYTQQQMMKKRCTRGMLSVDVLDISNESHWK